MALEIKVYLMDKPFKGEDIVIMGRALKDFTKHNLPYAVHVDNMEQIDSSNCDFIAVIFNSTPLCDIDFLKEKCNEMKNSHFNKYLIGDGYLEYLKCDNGKVTILSDPKAVKVVDYFDITLIYNFLKKKVLYKFAEQNVLIMEPASTYIDEGVVIGEGSIVYPMVTLKGNTVIGKNVKIYPFNYLEDTEIGDNSEVYSSYSQGAKAGSNTTIGPFACMRKGTVVGDNCRIGDFVEIKKSTLKNNVKVAHLAYIGDSFVDSFTNVGCGTVFANYDGKQKRSVKVGKNVFIGANTNLIAPLTIGDNVFIAAGSTVTKDLPNDSLCIARSRETVKPDYYKNQNKAD